LTIRGQP